MASKSPPSAASLLPSAAPVTVSVMGIAFWAMPVTVAVTGTERPSAAVPADSVTVGTGSLSTMVRPADCGDPVASVSFWASATVTVALSLGS